MSGWHIKKAREFEDAGWEWRQKERLALVRLNKLLRTMESTGTLQSDGIARSFGKGYSGCSGIN